MGVKGEGVRVFKLLQTALSSGKHNNEDKAAT